jgi:peptidoglycan/LPS O-acetylase OafA/YrhL
MNSSPATPKAENSTHITAFDTVRGLAALSVVFSHYINFYGWPTKSIAVKQAWTYSPLHIVWDGFAAVSLFYVLSGLVLSAASFSNQPCVSHLAAVSGHLPSQLWFAPLGGIF